MKQHDVKQHDVKHSEVEWPFANPKTQSRAVSPHLPEKFPPFCDLVIILLTADRPIVRPRRNDFNQTICAWAERVKGWPQPCGGRRAGLGIDI